MILPGNEFKITRIYPDIHIFWKTTKTDSAISGLWVANIPQDGLAALAVTEGSKRALESFKDQSLFRKG